MHIVDTLAIVQPGCRRRANHDVATPGSDDLDTAAKRRTLTANPIRLGVIPRTGQTRSKLSSSSLVTTFPPYRAVERVAVCQERAQHGSGR